MQLRRSETAITRATFDTSCADVSRTVNRWPALRPDFAHLADRYPIARSMRMFAPFH
jgi:hypothetical protein